MRYAAYLLSCKRRLKDQGSFQPHWNFGIYLKRELNFNGCNFQHCSLNKTQKEKTWMKTTVVWCQHSCGPQRYFQILWKVIFVNDLMHTLINLWHEDYDIRWCCSQLASTEFKTGSTYIIQSIVSKETRQECTYAVGRIQVVLLVLWSMKKTLSLASLKETNKSYNTFDLRQP